MDKTEELKRFDADMCRIRELCRLVLKDEETCTDSYALAVIEEIFRVADEGIKKTETQNEHKHFLQ